MKTRPIPIVSRTAAEQVANLKQYFHNFLFDWYRGIIAGVTPMPGAQEKILGELALALATFAAVAILADPRRANDDAIVADCEAMARDFVERLIMKFTSSHATGGTPS